MCRSRSGDETGRFKGCHAEKPLPLVFGFSVSITRVGFYVPSDWLMLLWSSAKNEFLSSHPPSREHPANLRRQKPRSLRRPDPQSGQQLWVSLEARHPEMVPAENGNSAAWLPRSGRLLVEAPPLARRPQTFRHLNTECRTIYTIDQITYS